MTILWVFGGLLAWTVLALGLGIFIGRAARLADARELLEPHDLGSMDCLERALAGG